MTQVQNNVFQFNFEKTYKEIDVAGKLYKVAFDDDSMLRYQVSFKEYESKVAEAQKIAPDVMEATVEQLKEMAEKQKDLMKTAIEIFLEKKHLKSFTRKRVALALT